MVLQIEPVESQKTSASTSNLSQKVFNFYYLRYVFNLNVGFFRNCNLYPLFTIFYLSFRYTKLQP